MATSKQKLPPMKKPAAAKKAAAPKPEPAAKVAPVKHERKAKPAEKDRIAERLRLAKSYLEQRDGMDSDTAQVVVNSMDPADLDALITEANTAVMARTPTPSTVAPAAAPSAVPPSPLDTGGTSAVPDPEEGAKPAVDFLSVPGLAEATWVDSNTGTEHTLPEIVIRCNEAAQTKNKAEAEYKADKKIIDAVLAGAGVGKNEPVTVFGMLRLTRYTGKSPRQLNEQKLLEKGVSPDIIKQCWTSGTYDDVRFTPIKEG